MADDHRRVRVWDAPTRVFHWLLVASFAGAWFTRDARYLDVHEFFGYAMAGLVAFRLVWGFTGTRWARFSSFRYPVSAAWRYLAALARRRQAHYLGHNPAGTWSIYGLLALAALEVVTGLVALGAEKRLGVLAGWFGYRVGDIAHALHLWLAYAMLALAAVHVLGVLAGSLADRENLVASMLTGVKRAGGATAGVDAKRGVAVMIVLVVALGAFAYFRAYPQTGDAARPPARAALALDPAWREECGDCHLAYHPSLLPARSWSRMFDEQASHFEEDLALGEETLQHLRAYAARNAAEQLASPVAWKMATTIPADAAPLRISATAYIEERHARLEAATWERVRPSDCARCHRDAEAGTFAPGPMIHVDLENSAGPDEKK
ncbi:MAG: cytochrome b/b6 domain-containing protein [Burkholderiales bacterium]